MLMLFEFQRRLEVARNQGHQSKCVSGRIRISAATRWRSTLYETCSFCYVLLVCVCYCSHTHSTHTPPRLLLFNSELRKSVHLCSPCAQLLHIVRHERETWGARMKNKTLLHVLWQLLWGPSVTQASIVLIKYCTILVHPEPSVQGDYNGS